MNKLTKLMLASAVLATSGFATEGTVSILSGSNPVGEGGIETIANNDVVLTGSMTLATSDTAENVAQLIVNEGRTFEVRSGTLSKSGTGAENAKITLKGTLKITEVDLNEDGTPDAPNVDLSNVAVEGETAVTYWMYVIDRGAVEVTNIAINGSETLGNKTLETGTSDMGDVLLWNGDYYVRGGTFNLNAYTYVSLEGSSRWKTIDGIDGFIIDMNNRAFDDVVGYRITDKRESSKGTVDLSALRSFREDAVDVKDYSANIQNISPTSLGEVKLPFNCKFSGIDLSGVTTVSYDVLKVGESSGAGIDTGVIKRVVTVAETTYGDYKNDSSLGVTTTAEGTERSVDGNWADINLSDVVSDADLNKSEYKLETDCLTTNSMEISSDTTYNFGLQGTKEISVTKSGSAAEGTKLVLAGDNSSYAPATPDNVTLPYVVEFAASNSLLPFSFAYEKGIFSGSSQTNSIASGISVEFTDGMELTAGNTLSVNGSLTL